MRTSIHLMTQPRKPKRNQLVVYWASKAEMERVKQAAGLVRVSTFIRKIVLDAINNRAASAA